MYSYLYLYVYPFFSLLLSLSSSLANRKRVTLKFLCELYFVAVIDEPKAIFGIITELVAYDNNHLQSKSNSKEKEKEKEIPNSYASLMLKYSPSSSSSSSSTSNSTPPVDLEQLYTITNIIISFLKYGNLPFCDKQSLSNKKLFQIASLPPLPIPEYVKSDHKLRISSSFLSYAQMLKSRCFSLHHHLNILEKKIVRYTLTRGDAGSEIQEESKYTKIEMEKLYSLLEVLYDLLECELEVLPPIVNREDEMRSMVSLESDLNMDGDNNANQLWDDEETRMFYESLPDLRIVVPPVLFMEGHTKEKARLRREMLAKERGNNEKLDEEYDNEDEDEKDANKTSLEEEVDFENMSITELEQRFANKQKYSKYDDDDDEDDNNNRTQLTSNHPMDLLLASLATSFNREQVDAAAEKFCYLNTKQNRVRLVESMYFLPRQSIDLIPYYGRLIATLHQYIPDM